MSASLTLYHANPRVTGAAMKMELQVADDVLTGGIWLNIAPQTGKTTFDWKEKNITVFLGFDELTKFMQVFRGECEGIAGGGIVLEEPHKTTTVKLDHRFDPDCHYALELLEHPAVAGEDRRMVFLMNNAEALGICEAIASSMGKIAFGEEA